MERESKIIVITPIKNEEWILGFFLETCSRFADAIVVAYQESSDNSLKIAEQYEKVTVIKNNDSSYNEAERQKLLINHARELFPNSNRILIALDADEIIAYHGLEAHLWDDLRKYPLGTMLYFEKPDMLPGLEKCIRWRDNYFYLGFVDNGDIHLGELIHSKRLPYSYEYPRVQIDSIKVLHLAHARIEAQLSKLRYYSVIENIRNTKPVYLRRFAYNPRMINSNELFTNRIESIEASWIGNSDYKNNLQKAVEITPLYTWHDVFVLEQFLHYGIKRFYLDNIWCHDWENTLSFCSVDISLLRGLRIKRPSFFYRLYGSFIDIMYRFYLRIRNAR